MQICLSNTEMLLYVLGTTETLSTDLNRLSPMCLTLQENILGNVMWACPHLTDQTIVSYTFVIVWKSHGFCYSAKAWSGTTDRSTQQSYYSNTSSKHQRRKVWKKPSRNGSDVHHLDPAALEVHKFCPLSQVGLLNERSKSITGTLFNVPHRDVSTWAWENSEIRRQERSVNSRVQCENKNSLSWGSKLGIDSINNKTNTPQQS